MSLYKQQWWLFVPGILDDPAKIYGYEIQEAVRDWIRTREHNQCAYPVAGGSEVLEGVVFTAAEYEAACDSSDSPDFGGGLGKKVNISGKTVAEYYCKVAT